MRATHATRRAYTAAELVSVVDLGEVAVAPDGREVAFTQDAGGAIELFTLALDADGRAQGAAQQRTDRHGHVTGLAYAPDGRSIVYEADRAGDEVTDLFLVHANSTMSEALTHTSDAAERRAHFSPDGTRLVFECDTPSTRFHPGVCVMDLATRATHRLTHETTSVEQPRWSLDGSRIVAVRTGDEQHGQLMVLDATSGAFTLAAQGAIRDRIFWPEQPDASGAMVGHATGPAGFEVPARLALPSGPVSLVESDARWDVEMIRQAGATQIVSRNVHGESVVTVVRGGVERVLSDRGVVTALDLDASGRRVVVARESSTHPPELVSLDVATGAAHTLIASRVGPVDPRDLSPAVRRTFVARDGLQLDAFVTQPRFARMGTPPPLVVFVHGGPGSQSRGAFAPMVQALAEAGFVVAAPNYRGSSGYGRAFEDANNHDWGGGDLGDLVAVADALARDGSVDRARTGIVGGSFGGYMVLRALTARPDRFAAGVDLYGMTDLVADYRMTVDRFGEWYRTEMGDPDHDAALFRDRSPGLALDRLHAPLLVMQGANDANVPRAESDALVQQLRARHAPVEYTVYPDEGHGFVRTQDRADSIARTVAFFVRTLTRH